MPKWFLTFLSVVITLVSTLGIPWAYTISTTVSAISAKIDSDARARGQEIETINRRLDRHDGLFDRLLGGSRE